MRRERASVFLRLFQTSVSTSISEILDVLASTAKEDFSNVIQPVLTQISCHQTKSPFPLLKQIQYSFPEPKPYLLSSYQL